MVCMRVVCRWYADVAMWDDGAIREDFGTDECDWRVHIVGTCKVVKACIFLENFGILQIHRCRSDCAT